jgi:hypothetical protein
LTSHQREALRLLIPLVTEGYTINEAAVLATLLASQ